MTDIFGKLTWDLLGVSLSGF